MAKKLKTKLKSVQFKQGLHRLATEEDFRQRGRLKLNVPFLVRPNPVSKELFEGNQTVEGMDLPSFKDMIRAGLVLVER